MAVQVKRPAVYLDDFMRVCWSDDISVRCCEQRTDLKVYYILFQVVSLVKSLVLDKIIVHGCLELRSFNFDRVTWEVKLTSFPFAEIQTEIECL